MCVVVPVVVALVVEAGGEVAGPLGAGGVGEQQVLERSAHTPTPTHMGTRGNNADQS